MAIEVTDIEEAAPESAPQESAPESASQESVPDIAPESAPEATRIPAKRGRPSGAKDKAPRKRRPVSIEPPPRPVTRRSAPRRVQIVEDESSEEVTPPPSPRTQRHQEWTAYRQRQADTHQANVNRYASLFDRMLA